jgi:hypothetical protein
MSAEGDQAPGAADAAPNAALARQALNGVVSLPLLQNLPEEPQPALIRCQLKMHQVSTFFSALTWLPSKRLDLFFAAASSALDVEERALGAPWGPVSRFTHLGASR